MIITFQSYANVNQNNDVIQYCPEKIECTVAGKLDSCRIVGDTYNIWQLGSFVPEKGTYIFQKAYAKYNIPKPHPYRPSCSYSNFNGKVEKQHMLSLNNKLDTSFQAYLDSASLWKVLEYDAECVSDDPKLCPLSEIPEVVIISNIYSTSYFPEFRFKPTNTRIYNPMSYNDAVAVCGNISRCDITVIENSQTGTYEAGYITLDLTHADTIKLLNITSYEPSRCALMKKEPFNIIYCQSR